MVPVMQEEPYDAAFEAVPVSLEVGRVYRFKGMRGPKQADGSQPWRYPPASYRLVAVGVDVHSFQQKVVYEGVSGSDAGRTLICGLSDWAVNFTLVEPLRDEGESEGSAVVSVSKLPSARNGTLRVAGRHGKGSGH